MVQANVRSLDSAAPGGETKPWIRGVNVGGWLLAERFITPYFFAVTSCHLEGDFCWYPGQIDAPPLDHPDYKACDLYQCKPHIIESASGEQDFPTDEWTLASSFASRGIAKRHFEYHWENFISREDVDKMKEAGVTHVRVPLPHWILGDIQPGEPWVDGGWLYFVRFVGWCRKAGLQVWPDVHTAPGSQNGFDNSGQLLPGQPTCTRWSESKEHVQRSLDVVQSIMQAIIDDSLEDVVTGFGILNEPFEDCDIATVRQFNEQALHTVRAALGPDTSIYIGDMFHAKNWNDGYWIDDMDYSNTYLDSHYYHVFAEEPRALSPKQHIAYVCGKNSRDANSCCYEDYPFNTNPSAGISRIIGEWSASFDTLPVAKLKSVMEAIAETGEAAEYDRQISKERRDFLKKFVQAQMVTYEAKEVGTSRGWFYWTLKMEGGAFAEWDFLRGVREGWIPKIPESTTASEDLYGTCHHIAESTSDNMKIVDEFPDPSTLPGQNWQGVAIDDDYVLSHADSMIDSPAVEAADALEVVSKSNSETTTTYSEFKTMEQSGAAESPNSAEIPEETTQTFEVPVSENASTISNITAELPTAIPTTVSSKHHAMMPLFFFGFLGFAAYRVFFGGGSGRQRQQYTSLDSASTLTV